MARDAQRSSQHEPLGTYFDGLRRSAGLAGLRSADRVSLDSAAGAWDDQLRVVAVNASHAGLAALDRKTFEYMVARVSWHEWGHALSVARATQDDVRDGTRLITLAPDSVAQYVRDGGYSPREYTYELVAEIYALLMSRRRRGVTERPSWLDVELYDLVRRVCGWNL